MAVGATRDGQRFLLLPPGAGLASLAGGKTSAGGRTGASPPAAAQSRVCLERVRSKTVVWGCVMLRCPGPAAGTSLHSQAGPTASQFLQNCLCGRFSLLLHTAQPPVYHRLAPRSIRDGRHGVNIAQRCPPSTAWCRLQTHPSPVRGRACTDPGGTATAPGALTSAMPRKQSLSLASGRVRAGDGEIPACHPPTKAFEEPPACWDSAALRVSLRPCQGLPAISFPQLHRGTQRQMSLSEQSGLGLPGMDGNLITPLCTAKLTG